MNMLELIEKEQMRGDIPSFKAGDTVKVYVRIIEGQKQRICKNMVPTRFFAKEARAPG